MAKKLKPDSLIVVTVLILFGAIWWGLTRSSSANVGG